ncbi:MAG: NosD domain-containing protein [Phycisphaerae bacterium]
MSIARMFVVLAVVMAALFAPRRAAAREWIVDWAGGGDFVRIADAVAAAADDDIVTVRPGVYPSEIRLTHRRLTIRGTNPDDPNVVAATILEARAAGARHLIIEDQAVVAIEGLTLRNAVNQFIGGSTHVGQSTVVFRGNRWIRNRVLDDRGGAIFAYDADLTLIGNEFVKNESRLRGAALVVERASRLTLLENRFVDNECTGVTGYSRSAAYVECAVVAERNEFIGIGLSIEDAPNARITANVCGGVSEAHRGIRVGDVGGAIVANNVLIGSGAGVGITIGAGAMQVTGNTATGYLRGIDFSNAYDSLNDIVHDNAIYDNLTGIAYHQYPDVDCDFAFNCIDNLYRNLVRDVLGEFEGRNNFFTDPGVRARGTWTIAGLPDGVDDVYVPGDVHLAPRSVCIDAAGEEFPWPAEDVDLDGQPRGMNGRRDIGADESPALGDLDGDGVVTAADIDAFVLALVDPAAHRAAYPRAEPAWAGDCNGDARFDNFDIDAFVALIHAVP